MNNIINMDDHRDFDSCTYFTTRDKGIGITMKDDSLSIYPLSNGRHEVSMFGETDSFSRADLAEFIHVASMLIDDERKWEPSGIFAAHDY